MAPKSPTHETLEPLIFTIRGRRVVLDADLARIYGATTKRFNEAFKRNGKRFPDDFVFQLTAEEFSNLRSQFAASSLGRSLKDETNWSQFATSSSRRRGTTYRPWAFTEHGAIMAANILRNDRAVQMSVYVVRAFVRLREQIAANQTILKRLAEIDKSLLPARWSIARHLWEAAAATGTAAGRAHKTEIGLSKRRLNAWENLFSLFMCGIAGIFNRSGRPVNPAVLRDMAEIQKHRGPDDDGFYVNGNVGLGQRRLSIIDLSGGKQPIHNEGKDVWVVFNGEIFNYPELRAELEKKGHRFYTHTDTETIVHAYEEYGLDFVDHLNGQFAIAIWDEKQKRLVLARDRVGICPLHYAWLPGGDLIFSSEMKGLFRHPDLTAELDPKGIGQIFTFWANVPPRTVFKDVLELPPGHLLVATPDRTDVRRYWELRFPDAGDYENRPLEYYASGVREMLHDATTLRLRADVPVAAYLSGGIDSSVISALVKKYHNPGLVTFSVSFADADYDEKVYQLEMARHLGVDHRSIEIDYADIGRVFPQVVWHAEKPMTRTAPAPLYKLAGLVRENGIKVVLTGEGSDEIFGGYNIFLEDKIRRFWARQPDSKMRPGLLSRLYPEFNKNAASQEFWRQFFRKGLGDTDNPYYSHLIRWQNTAHLQNLFDTSFRDKMGGEEERYAELDAYVSPDLTRWHPLCRAQYLETVLFMSGYLLSSQGDRMLLGQSIEGRFPFLDHRLIEFAAKIPPRYKIHHLREKHVLKEAFRDLVPERIVERPKQPYRAPISQCFLNPEVGEANAMLSAETTRAAGYFDAGAVEQLVAKLQKSGGASASAREDMAVVGIVSLHSLHRQFLKEPVSC